MHSRDEWPQEEAHRPTYRPHKSKVSFSPVVETEHVEYSDPTTEAETTSSTRGGDSTLQTDGDDGDGQGSRFWAVRHSLLGEAPFGAPQARKILAQNAVFL